MHEATLRLEPGGPYGAPTAGTDAVVELWCNDHCDLLAIRGEGGERVLAAIEDRVGVSDRIEREDRTLAITADCLREREGTIERHLGRHGCLLLPPLRYARGAKICRVLALDPADLTALYRDLVDERSVTVESKRSVDAPAVEDPFGADAGGAPALTDRQREVLLAAHDRGYYELPRETTTAAVGDAVGVGRRTAEEHLRRAERKILDAVVDRIGP
ncbi:helix-turn-helix domain-containing protein [Halovivax sp.]|uniref:helix-turn-helix domain-containing protein n=1 Tax=Halovivax sp. TaxID=1935978 RepID=UPI0025C703D5|nr:helix-turn-helix domain-containing protein [Halovivax sp.]